MTDEIEIVENKIVKHVDNPQQLDQYFYANGKLLLSGEYFVLDGAKSLALPTKLGQSLSVRYSSSFSPTLRWKSYDCNDELWFEAMFEFWQFNCLQTSSSKEAQLLQKMFKEIRKTNLHFLRDNVDVEVSTHLNFPLFWGLGSSSTLIYNMANWGRVNPFELFKGISQGSGYDVACAGNDGAIIYRRKSHETFCDNAKFEPTFKDNLYFLYLGRKQNSNEGINLYQKRFDKDTKTIDEISCITDNMLTCESLEEFEKLICTHEQIISKKLRLGRVKDEYFKGYWGEVKSLGAWGGDFVLVTSNRSMSETEKYFADRGFTTFIKYSDLIKEREKRERNSLLQ